MLWINYTNSVGIAEQFGVMVLVSILLLQKMLSGKLDSAIPWPFYTIRDTRTIFDLCNVSLKMVTVTTHKAVEDAEHQAS